MSRFIRVIDCGVTISLSNEVMMMRALFKWFPGSYCLLEISFSVVRVVVTIVVKGKWDFCHVNCDD